MYIFGQVLDVLCIPQTEVVVARHEDLVRVGETDEPVEKVEHLFLRSVVGKVAAVHDDICSRKSFQLSVAAMRVGNLEYSQCREVNLLFPIVLLPGFEIDDLVDGFVPVTREADPSVIEVYISFHLPPFGTDGLIWVMVDIVEADVIIV